jgi:hypothetical protein
MPGKQNQSMSAIWANNIVWIAAVGEIYTAYKWSQKMKKVGSDVDLLNIVTQVSL